MTMIPPAAPDAWAIAPGADDTKVLIDREYRRVVESSPDLRKSALVQAALNLGKDGRIPLEAAEAALVRAARAGNHPLKIDGEDLAAFIRGWLLTRRQLVPDQNRTRDRGRVSQSPTAQPAPADAAPAPALETALPAPRDAAARPTTPDLPAAERQEARLRRASPILPPTPVSRRRICPLSMPRRPARAIPSCSAPMRSRRSRWTGCGSTASRAAASR
jgi:hypothetical protein